MAALRAAGGGPTLVVSPLLALMRDQITAAGRAGLRAATVNSTNVDDWDEVLTEMGAGRLDVLLISPERLSNPAFARQLPDLLRAVGLLVIDEAHCISDWGFDFRPDYQRLTRTLLGLAPGLAGRAQALLASAVSASTGGLIWLSGPLYAAAGGGAFWAMAALCALAAPLAWRLR